MMSKKVLRMKGSPPAMTAKDMPSSCACLMTSWSSVSVSSVFAAGRMAFS